MKIHSSNRMIPRDTSYDDNRIDVVGEYGGKTVFCQLTNTSTMNDILVRVDGKAEFTIPAASTQVFNQGDLDISSLEFKNNGKEGVPIEVMFTVEDNPKKVVTLPEETFFRLVKTLVKKGD